MVALGRIEDVKRPIRLIAIDLDGTLLNSKVELSQENCDALWRAHEAGIEIVLGTGRRHDFALPFAKSLGFDLWMFSSNGAVTRSTRGETFHRICAADRESSDGGPDSGDVLRAGTVDEPGTDGVGYAAVSGGIHRPANAVRLS